MSLARNTVRTGVALGLGAVGGYVFFRLSTPLPWMLGAMFATLVATLAGVPLGIDPRLRNGALPVMGVLVGSSFAPGILGDVARWPGGIALVIVFASGVTWIGFAYLRWVAGWDRATAIFSAPPGGLSQMLLIGMAAGADERRILLFHSIRIVVAVAGSSLVVRYVLGYQFASIASGSVAAGGGGLGVVDGAVLLACAVCGELIGRVTRLPGGGMLGALVLSAAVHLSGISQVAPPGWVIIAAQVLLGAGLGGRFVGLTRAELARVVRHAVLWGAFLVAAALATALLAAPALDLDPAGLFLALAPGGFSEMLLVALAIGIEPAFVATCHTLRIVFVVAAVPLIGGLALRRAGGEGSQ